MISNAYLASLQPVQKSRDKLVKNLISQTPLLFSQSLSTIQNKSFDQEMMACSPSPSPPAISFNPKFPKTIKSQNIAFGSSLSTKTHFHPLQSQQLKKKSFLKISASISTSEEVRTSPDDLVASILSKVSGTDGGVTLTKEEHDEVAAVARELQGYCVDEPVKCPLIFGEWDVAYCSRPTSPGGGFRSGLGRMVFKTKEMIQVVEAPDSVNNKVSFSAFGFLDGEVSLKGKLKVLDEKWIQVVFEPPELKVGPLEFRYGGQSEVKLAITYVDEKIRLGKGSRGSLFVFRRC